MIQTINRNKSWPSFPKLLWQYGFFIGEKMQRKVRFYSNCRYDLDGVIDDEDVNKLFGFGFFPGHQKNSARFGWFFDNEAGKIVLMAYCYVNGKPIREQICEVNLNTDYHLKITISKNSYMFWVKDSDGDLLEVNTIFHDGKTRNLGYKLGLYFGGDKKAPHKMKVKISRL